MRTGADRLLWAIYARQYDRLWDHPLTSAVAGSVADHLDHALPTSEVGAGTGLVTACIERRGIEVDASEPRLAMARPFQERLGRLPRLLPLHEVAASTAPRNVVAVNVLHLTEDPGAALGHLRRLAGPGGRVIWATPAAGVTMWSMTRALRTAGWPRRRILGFVTRHALLAPLVALAGAGLDRRPAIHRAGSELVTCVGGVVDVLVAPGRSGGDVEADRPAGRHLHDPSVARGRSGVGGSQRRKRGGQPQWRP